MPCEDINVSYGIMVYELLGMFFRLWEFAVRY